MGKIIALMCCKFLTNLYTELTVQACNRFTLTSITNGLVEMSISFLHSTSSVHIEDCEGWWLSQLSARGLAALNPEFLASIPSNCSVLLSFHNGRNAIIIMV